MSQALPASRFGADKALSTHDQIARTLGMEILSGVHAPGANLPHEADLLSRFAVSRTLLREVIKTLTAKGLVISKTRVGTRVTDPVNWNYFDAEVLAWQVGLGMDADFRRHLSEIRWALEPRAAALAAEHRSASDVAELRRCIAAMRAVGHTRRSFAETDLVFHLAVATASGNPLLRSMAAVIEAALIASFSLSSPADRAELQESVTRKHELIVDAIEAKDPAAAAKAMLGVIDDGVERIERELGGDSAAPAL